jgi:hypothetical protein
MIRPSISVGFGDEVQVQAMVAQGAVLDVDNDSLIVVTMEHGAPCEYSNYKFRRALTSHMTVVIRKP